MEWEWIVSQRLINGDTVILKSDMRVFIKYTSSKRERNTGVVATDMDHFDRMVNDLNSIREAQS